jgi:hypothetical protein
MRVRGEKGGGAHHTSNSRHGAHNQHQNSPADDYILNMTHLTALVGELELDENAATCNQRARINFFDDNCPNVVALAA